MNLAAFEATRSRFDRGASRWVEALWYACKSVFFLSPIPFPSAWKCAILRAFGARIGRDVTIHPRVNIKFPWRLEIGDHVWIGEEVFLLNLAPVRIGSHCCLSQRAFLCTGSHNYRRDTFDLVLAPVTIESESWLAAQCFVAPGVTIGPNSVIGAGSIVTRDVPPKTLAAGNPAAPIRSLEA